MTQAVCDPPQTERGDDGPSNAPEDKIEVAGSVGIRDRLEHFTWAWFSCTMATGSLAVVLALTPNRFNGLNTVGKVFFVTDLVLFVTFTVLMITRFILAPPKLALSLHHPPEGLFFGTFWVSVSLIISCIQLYGVPSCGPWLVKALEILFWIYYAMALLVAIFQNYVFFQEERLQVKDAMPAWIFPVYPLIVVGPMAGNLLKSQPHHAAYPMWVGAVMLQGLGWAVSLMMYSAYTQRLMMSSLPSPPMRPGMYVSVGPAGYTAAGLLSLGSIAPSVLPEDAFNTKTIHAGDIALVLGIISGTFLLLFAFWFCSVSTLAVITGIKRMSFTLSWWAFIFPNSGMTLGAIQLGKAYNSPGINGVCSALTIALVAAWLMTAYCHIKALWQGTILYPGKDEDKTMKVPGRQNHQK